jgi:pantetheine-phosphate adenylyltransferase
MPRTALYPGTFDPFTNGHLHILQRISAFFDRIVIAVSTQSDKKPLLSIEQRVVLIKSLYHSMPQISVQSFDGLLVDFAQHIQANAIVRGVRNAQDFAYEQQLAAMNHELAPNVETLLFMAHPSVAHVSSTWVRDIVCQGGDVSAFVPKIVADALRDMKQSPP